jgi:copper chaperone CopZ
MVRSFSVCVATFALVVVLIGSVDGGGGQAKAPDYSVITVENMHCANCAKRIGGKLQEVPGIAKIQYDIEKKLFWAHPQPGKQVSPRALWDAIEKGNDTPLKIQGPQGTFVKRPNS